MKSRVSLAMKSFASLTVKGNLLFCAINARSEISSLKE